MKNPLNFLDFSLTDIIDIFLVATLLYYLYKLVKGTAAVNIFAGIVIIYVIFQITKLLQMELLSSIFDNFFQAGFLALILVFQQEIRKFLLMVGSSNLASRGNFIKHFHFLRSQNKDTLNTNVSLIIKACQKLSASKTGALIVLQRNNSLDFVKTSGDHMNAEVNIPLLESIFYKNSPLHDGAIVIKGNTITATRVILPVSDERTIPQRFGLRHRAAIGITEKTDALSLVVSEETGQISFMKNGEFVLFRDINELINIVSESLQ
ncbi:membrane protein [Neptunitalea chrysea]|uniref:Diadenylate cyclase n=1 Tax=Neptunitalea chrysea TaxID=1647581 RepID=A0A9W6B773_9FLAO|nr:diadenylate cyclase CdaA [Neptunitalea chrysea]GLB54024.1 membrane protein [Neptunitalea chrysea]